jgi:tricorn protease-like protein
MTSVLIIWNLKGEEIRRFSRGLRVNHVAISLDGTQIVCTTADKEVWIADTQTYCFEVVKSRQLITSFSLSRDPSGRYALMNVSQPGELHLWDLKPPYKVIKRFQGLKQARFIVRSTFGGWFLSAV